MNTNNNFNEAVNEAEKALRIFNTASLGNKMKAYFGTKKDTENKYPLLNSDEVMEDAIKRIEG